MYYVPLMSYEAASLKRQKYELTTSLEKASLPTSCRLKVKSSSLLQQGPRKFGGFPVWGITSLGEGKGKRGTLATHPRPQP